MPEWLMQVVGLVFTAGAIYGAIRGDILTAHEKAKDAKASADHAHNRIDDILRGCRDN